MENGVFEDLKQARSEIFISIEGYYNRAGLHSSLGCKSSLEFEMELQTKNGGKKRRFFVWNNLTISVRVCKSRCDTLRILKPSAYSSIIVYLQESIERLR